MQEVQDAATTFCLNYRPHFVGLNGHPYGYPYVHHILGYLFFLGSRTPWCSHISLGSTSLNYCPFGAGMYAGGAGCSHHFLPKLSATLRGPQWAPLWGTHVGTLYRAPTFQINIMFYVAHMWGTMPIEQSVPMEKLL